MSSLISRVDVNWKARLLAQVMLMTIIIITIRSECQDAEVIFMNRAPFQVDVILLAFIETGCSMCDACTQAGIFGCQRQVRQLYFEVPSLPMNGPIIPALPSKSYQEQAWAVAAY